MLVQFSPWKRLRLLQPGEDTAAAAASSATRNVIPYSSNASELMVRPILVGNTSKTTTTPHWLITTSHECWHCCSSNLSNVVTARPGKTTRMLLQDKVISPIGWKLRASKSSPIVVYTLSHSNKVLSGYNCTTAATHDASMSSTQDKITVQLHTQAWSLDLLVMPSSKSLVYGAYTDGSLFVGYISTTKQQLSHLYSRKQQEKDSITKKQRPLYCHATCVDSKVVILTQALLVWEETKAKDTQKPRVEVYQHHIHLQEEEEAEKEDWKSSCQQILVKDLSDEQQHQVQLDSLRVNALIPSKRLLVRWLDDENHWQFEVMDVSSKKEQQQQPSPIMTPSKQSFLPAHTSLGVVTESMVALLAKGNDDKQELVLYDVLYESIVWRQSLSHVTSEQQLSLCRLVTDINSSTVALLCPTSEEDHSLQIYTSSLLVGEQNNTGPAAATSVSKKKGITNSYTLAVALQSFATTTTSSSLLSQKRPRQQDDDPVHKALAHLLQCRNDLCDTQNQAEPVKRHLSHAYEEALAMAVMAPAATTNGDSSPAKKKAALSKQNGLPNGGSHMNGGSSHHATPAKWVSKKQKVVPPQRFLNGALSIILSLLQKMPFSSEHKQAKQRVYQASFDARILLDQILRTGTISARRHFMADSEPKADDPLLYAAHLPSLLAFLGGKSFQLPSPCRIMSPTRLIDDLLTHCSDLSEGMLVQMILYALTEAAPLDIATMFTQNKNAPAKHKAVAQEYMQTKKELTAADRQQHEMEQRKSKKKPPPQSKSSDTTKTPDECTHKMERLSKSLIKSYALYLVRRIVSYSRCNDALLRQLLRDMLPDEAAVALMNVLSTLLGNCAIDCYRPSSSARMKHQTTSLVQWISCLMDVHASAHLLADDEEDSKLPFGALQKTVQFAVTQADSIIELQSALEMLLTSDSDESTVPTLVSASPNKRKKGMNKAIPAYSTERLAF